MIVLGGCQEKIQGTSGSFQSCLRFQNLNLANEKRQGTRGQQKETELSLLGSMT